VGFRRIARGTGRFKTAVEMREEAIRLAQAAGDGFGGPASDPSDPVTDDLDANIFAEPTKPIPPAEQHGALWNRPPGRLYFSWRCAG
jgi:hypothetical protein